MPAQGGVKFFPTCDLDYQVRTKSGEGQLTAACPHRGGGVQILSYVWIGLSRFRTKSSEVIWLNSDSSQQHAHTGGVRFSPTCKVNYQVRTISEGRSSDSSQQHARTGGVKFSPTCDLDYQARTKSGEGQLTAACPHRGRVKFSPTCKVTYQVRTKSGEDFGQLTAACPHRGASNSLLRVRWTIRFGL